MRGRAANHILRADHISSTTRNVYYNVRVGNVTASTQLDAQSVRNFVPVTFSDANINGGAPTEGLLEILGENINRFEHRIRLVRLVFDDASPSRPLVKLNEVFAEWGAPPVTATATDTATRKIERKIAMLERKIRQIRTRTRVNSPRLNFYRMPAGAVRQINELEREIATLKRRLGGASR